VFSKEAASGPSRWGCGQAGAARKQPGRGGGSAEVVADRGGDRPGQWGGGRLGVGRDRQCVRRRRRARHTDEVAAARGRSGSGVGS
jgi:hypothetical protein